MKWSFVDAMNMAFMLVDSNESQHIDVDELVNSIWSDMQASNEEEQEHE